ncbi:MAG: tyrosine-type recombinase/integrase [Bacteroidota bacterium]|jgi:site-specific recombinase XerD
MTKDNLEKYKEYLQIKAYTTSSITGNVKNAEYFLNWLNEQNITIEESTHNDVMAYVNYKRKAGNKAKTLQYIVINLNHYYNFLIEENTVIENAASHIKIQDVKRKTLYEILTPQELENIYKSYNTQPLIAAGRACPPQEKNILAKKRNKIILGLLVYQGIKAEEIGKLELTDLQLREGKITIQGAKRSNARTLKLEPHQIIDLLDYINETRKEILALKQKLNTELSTNYSTLSTQNSKLFLSTGTSDNYKNLLQKLVKNIKALNPKLKDIQHIRTSVITNWLKTNNLRKTQYMAGHRYVSSTESYQANNIDALKEDLLKYHPLV